ncbi:MAG: hypothetical protein IPO32_16855 [Crocinitomicaceae bacterium]|nr:hypothetical protein [Crocinitomicaceae bacterium]
MKIGMSFVSPIKNSFMKNRLFFIALTLSIGSLVMMSCKVAREKRSETKGSETKDSVDPRAELVANFDAYRNSASCTILKVIIDGNTMILDVEYSGGCEEHTFKLLGSEMIQKSLPPKRGIMLWHDNKGDSCRSIVNEQLKFDISVLAYAGGEIILNLDGWATPISYTQAK